MHQIVLNITVCIYKCIYMLCDLFIASQITFEGTSLYKSTRRGLVEDSYDAGMLF